MRLDRPRVKLAVLAHTEREALEDLIDSWRLSFPDSVSEVLLYDGSPEGDFHPGIAHVRRLESSSPVRWGKNLHNFHLAVAEDVARADDSDYLVLVDSDVVFIPQGIRGLMDSLASDAADFAAIGIRRVSRGDDWAWASRALIAREVMLGPGDTWACFNPIQIWSRDHVAVVNRCSSRIKANSPSTGLWACEEVIFPTLAASTGLRVRSVSDDARVFQGKHAPFEIQTLVSSNAPIVHKVALDASDPMRVALREHRHGLLTAERVIELTARTGPDAWGTVGRTRRRQRVRLALENSLVRARHFVDSR